MVDVLYDKYGGWGGVLQCLFVLICSFLPLLFNDDDWMLAVMVLDSEQLLLLPRVQLLVLIGVVVMPFEKHIAYEFVSPWRMYAEPAPVYRSWQRGENEVGGALQVHDEN